jgi:hypothetical protein
MTEALSSTVRNPHGANGTLSQRPRMTEGTPAERKRVADKLSDIPKGQLACRAGRHKWPSDDLEFGKPIPKGMETAPAPGGCHQIIDVCRRCGKRRIVTTMPGGVLDPAADYDYKDPKDWVRLSRELKVRKRELRAYNILINQDRLFGGQ